MARITEQFRVSRPADEVFGAIADFTTSAQWDPMITSAAQVVGDRPGPGAAYDLTLKMGPVPTTFRYVTEVHSPTGHVVHATENRWAWGRDDVRIAADGEGTEVTWTADFALKGPGGLFDPLLQKGFQKVGARAVAGLKDWLQSGGKGRVGDEQSTTATADERTAGTT
jgi:carbon monoxide dehydrogenase subunit G